MDTSQTILFILQNKKLTCKDKFFILVEIIFSSLLEEFFFVSKEKALLQIQSEVLYALEKLEGKEIKRAWITTRLNFLKKTLIQHKNIKPRTDFEISIDFLENIPSAQPLDHSSSNHLVHTHGWNKKTYQRFERYVLRKQKKTQIKKREVIQPTLIQGL